MAERVNDLQSRPGITMRDYFAGQALIGILHFWEQWCLDNPNAPAMEQPMAQWHQRAAQAAYHYADAMLAERDKEH